MLKVVLGPRPTRRYLVEVGAAQQVRFVGFRIYTPGGSEARLLLRCHLDPNLASHVASYLPLHGNDVPRIELVSLRPEMALRRRPHKFGSDADSISTADQGAFEQRIHLELLRHLRRRFR